MLHFHFSIGFTRRPSGNNLSLASSLQSLAHRRTVASSSLFYRCYFGLYPSKLALAVSFLVTSRSSCTWTVGHAHQVSVTWRRTSLFPFFLPDFQIVKHSLFVFRHLRPLTFQEQNQQTVSCVNVPLTFPYCSISSDHGVYTLSVYYFLCNKKG